jgi:guanosine-3',5'-bis(diphosphate) 3'-pyrophosphohydrolase
MQYDIDGLIKKVKAYNPGAKIALLQQAYDFAEHHHRDQKRSSGEAYISHPLAVAYSLADLKLDLPSIITGLLHDTVEDTEATLDDIRKNFSEEIAYLVDGVTKLSRIELQSKSQTQAENLRKLVLAMAQDIRVLIIKLMDRLHNMQTLEYIPSLQRRQSIALETIEIYAPLAQRIGMFTVQEQLQNMAFAVLNPDAYEAIQQRLAEFHEKGQDIVKEVIEDLERILKEGGMTASVYGREKKPYSIWRKMQRKNINFDQLSDLFAVRVIVEAKADCYQTLGLIHHAKVVIPKTFKDYISTPKSNHYEALHTKVLGPHGTRLEIQIRTKHMQEVAERGVAAHWQYKQGIPARDMKNYQWLQGLLDILEQTSGAEEFLEHTKLEMFQDQAFCFTPKGDIINLPNGATVIDFAYALHSEIGNTCKGAKVNGRLVPLKTELQNGDQVEILTDKNVRPSPEWEQIAITGKAQANIRRFIRSQKRSQFKKLGQSIYENELTPEQQDTLRKAPANALRYFHLFTFDDLLVALGEGKVQASDVRDFVLNQAMSSAGVSEQQTFKDKPAVIIKGLVSGVAVHYGGCCHPLPGDKITGIITVGKGVTVHRATCEILQQYEHDPKRWLNLAWGKTEGSYFQGRLVLTVQNTPNALGDVVNLIAKNNGDITNFRILKRHKDFFEMMVDMQVRNLLHLEQIIGFLRAMTIVEFVERPENP